MQREYQYIVGKIQQALANDPRVCVLDVKVLVTDGEVYLSGEVETEEQRRAVAEVAAEVAPGYRVHNETTVREVASASGFEDIR